MSPDRQMMIDEMIFCCADIRQVSHRLSKLVEYAECLDEEMPPGFIANLRKLKDRVLLDHDLLVGLMP